MPLPLTVATIGALPMSNMVDDIYVLHHQSACCAMKLCTTIWSSYLLFQTECLSCCFNDQGLSGDMTLIAGWICILHQSPRGGPVSLDTPLQSAATSLQRTDDSCGERPECNETFCMRADASEDNSHCRDHSGVDLAWDYETNKEL